LHSLVSNPTQCRQRPGDPTSRELSGGCWGSDHDPKLPDSRQNVGVPAGPIADKGLTAPLIPFACLLPWKDHVRGRGATLGWVDRCEHPPSCHGQTAFSKDNGLATTASVAHRSSDALSTWPLRCRERAEGADHMPLFRLQYDPVNRSRPPCVFPHDSLSVRDAVGSRVLAAVADAHLILCSSPAPRVLAEKPPCPQLTT